MASLHCNRESCETIIICCRQVDIWMLHQQLHNLNMTMFSCTHKCSATILIPELMDISLLGFLCSLIKWYLQWTIIMIPFITRWPNWPINEFYVSKLNSPWHYIHDLYCILVRKGWDFGLFITIVFLFVSLTTLRTFIELWLVGLFNLSVQMV